MALKEIMVPSKDIPGVYTSTDKPIKGLYIIVPVVYEDPRGHFTETFNEYDFISNGIIDKDHPFVQDNESLSSYGVIRGLHLQRAPYGQAKLVRVVSGEVLDVAVDLRIGSETFGEWVAVKLSEENRRMFYIPRDFGHGFGVLSEKAKFLYKTDSLFHKPAEVGIRYNDPQININWQKLTGIPADKIITSEKDRTAGSLKDFIQKMR